MLRVRTLFHGDGVQISDVACRHTRGRGQNDEQTGGHAVVFVRRGCFLRSAEGAESLLDQTLAYCMNPGEEQRYDHPHDHGDDCTSLFLAPEMVASLWGGEQSLPSEPLRTSPEVDLEHRLLLRAARHGEDRHEILERAVSLTAQALRQADSRRVEGGRPSSTAARRKVVDGAREILAANLECSLPDIAGELAVSSHHLSRVFHAATGHTVSRHRMRVRTRHVLERLAGGEQDLARLAADLGFADQSHLCRVVRKELGRTPTALRDALS